MNSSCHYKKIYSKNYTALQQTLSTIFANDPKHYCFLMREYDLAAHGTGVSLTPLCRVQPNQLCSCDMHSGVIDTTVICTADSLTPLWHAQRSHWHFCDMHSGVIDITVSMTRLCKYDTAVTLDLIIEWLWLPLKGISMKMYIGKLTYTLSIIAHKILGLTKDRFLSAIS
jgi:hypothetical protein